MSLTNPPDAITALHDMLVASSAASAAGISTSTIWYPALAIDPDAGTTDGLPAALLAEETHRQVRYAAGAGGLPGGTLICTIFKSGYTAGQMEDLGRDIAADLMSQQTGLPITSVNVGLCSDPIGAQRAELDYRTITLTIEWGLNP